MLERGNVTSLVIETNLEQLAPLQSVPSIIFKDEPIVDLRFGPNHASQAE